MALDKKVYEVLEEIVGPENISEEPVILDGYAFQQHHGTEQAYGGLFCPRPEAVILPETTDEIQAIVRVCNRYKLKVKPHSTGWGFWAAPSGEGIIQLDLRRMNRILEIDDENMYAVVEPYVIGSQLQAEAMKRGLNCHIIGAGGSCSILASTTSMVGYGLSGISTGFGGRNLLGAEWVSPLGEVLKLGSLGSGAGWFCGDGPGPSLRGILRGFIGAAGGFGIFTKVAVKLYPWPGPPEMPIQGVTPSYYSPLPENIRDYTVTFSSWDSFADAWYKISEAEIGYVMGKQISAFGSKTAVAQFLTLSNPDLDNDDIPELLESPDVRELTEELAGPTFQLTIAAHSSSDLEYQIKALEKIVEETRGKIHPLFADPGIEELMHVMMIKVDRNNLIFDAAGRFGTSFGIFSIPDTLVGVAKAGEEVKRRHIEKGGLMDDGGESTWGGLYERGRIGGHLEELFQYDPHDPKSWQAAWNYLLDAGLAVMTKGWPPGLSLLPALALSEEERAPFFAVAGEVIDLLRWQGRIKRAFDPNIVSDPGHYITVKEAESK